MSEQRRPNQRLIFCQCRAGVRGTPKRNEGAYVARVAVCLSDAAEAAGVQPDRGADSGAGDWGYVCGFQFDSGRVAYTAAVSKAGATRADFYSAHRWTEDGQQPARLGSATVDGMAEGRDIVRGNR